MNNRSYLKTYRSIQFAHDDVIQHPLIHFTIQKKRTRENERTKRRGKM